VVLRLSSHEYVSNFRQYPKCLQCHPCPRSKLHLRSCQVQGLLAHVSSTNSCSQLRSQLCCPHRCNRARHTFSSKRDLVSFQSRTKPGTRRLSLCLFLTPHLTYEQIHMKLMCKYAPCPDWWYGILLFISIMLGLATVLAYDSQLPWWGYFVSLLIALIFLVPTCMIYGIANIQLSLNVISPFLAGYMLPGRPIGVMLFKVFSTVTLGQAELFSSDLKLAHYMKIPPKTAFTAQVAAAVWSCFVQIAVMNWTLDNIADVCTRLQPGHFTCPNGRAFFSNSITWGVIGPDRMFGPGTTYSSIHYFWLIGAMLPVLFYVVIRLAPKSPARYLNAPIMLGAMAWLPPAAPISFSSWAIIGLIFNYWIMRKWPGWWHKYNYITAAGLDSGLVIATIVIFFAITLKDYTIPQWWGNIKPYETTVCGPFRL
jgi:OPT family small oligopeptide transporter